MAQIIFEYQLKNNPVFFDYYSNLGKPNFPVFLPISAFKKSVITCSKSIPTTYFESSGTTSTINSRHYYFDLPFYLDNAAKIFETEYGPLNNFCFLALLPHYLERSNSSLIEMVNHFINQSKYEQSGFFLNNTNLLYDKLVECKSHKIPTILFGVSFALLDFAEKYDIKYPELIIMETGGMKGRRPEITRDELHKAICNAFGTEQVHSEYGMTELFSQAYSKGNGIFKLPNTMKIYTTEISDPFTFERKNKNGIINIIDLANLDSCSFIKTDDLGIVYDDGSFAISGRLDQSDIRGCNLLVTDI